MNNFNECNHLSDSTIFVVSRYYLKYFILMKLNSYDFLLKIEVHINTK